MNPDRRHGLTLQQHANVGRGLTAMRGELMKLQRDVLGPAYCVGHDAHRRIRRTLDWLDRLRCTLDDAAFDEHPSDASARLYYPRPPQLRLLKAPDATP
jgi:hypothetical protein